MPPDSASQLSDQELLQMVTLGDELAFQQLYQRYQLAIYNYVLRLIHQENAAEELLQDVFLAVWQGAKRFRNQSSVKTWIFRIAHFRAVSWLRKHHKARLITEYSADMPLVSPEPSPEENLIDKAELSQVLAALETLSANHRAVIELTFAHGFAYQQIAEVMGCPVGTVKSRMSYALKYLNAELNQKNK
jgi:RNA polymerase sigma-70 factor (ECF subfamily)